MFVSLQFQAGGLFNKFEKPCGISANILHPFVESVILIYFSLQVVALLCEGSLTIGSMGSCMRFSAIEIIAV